MEEKLLSTQAYKKIKEGILSLKFPPGSLLKERELARDLGMSRTPVREAIQRLCQERWLTTGTEKRMQVRPVTLADVYEIIQIRNIIEYAALRDIVEKGRARLVAGQLDLILNEMKNTSEECLFVHLDIKFHYAIVESIHNERLLNFWSNIQEEVLRIGLLVLREKGRWQEVVLEHEAVVEALWEKAPAKVHSAMQRHLERSYESILNDFNRKEA